MKISNFRNSADFDWSGKKTDPTKSLQALHTFAPSGLAAINICSQLASALCSLPSARLQAAPGPFPSFLASFLWRRHWIFSFLSGAPSLATFLFLRFGATLSPPSRSPIASQLGLVGTPFPRPRHWLAPFFCSCSSPRLAICPDVAASSGCPAMDLPREARCFVTPQ